MLFHKWRALPEPHNYTPSTALPWRWHWSRDIRKSPTFKLLRRIESASGQVRDKADGGLGKRTWLLPFRDELRQLLAGFDSRFDGEVDVVRCYLLTCPRTMIAICVWLVGEFSDRRHLYELKDFSPRSVAADTPTRGQSIAAIGSMVVPARHGRRLSRRCQDSMVCRAPTTHAHIRERLKNFKRNASTIRTRARWQRRRGCRSGRRWSSWETHAAEERRRLIRRMLQADPAWVRWGVSRERDNGAAASRGGSRRVNFGAA